MLYVKDFQVFSKCCVSKYECLNAEKLFENVHICYFSLSLSEYIYFLNISTDIYSQMKNKNKK